MLQYYKKRIEDIQNIDKINRTCSEKGMANGRVHKQSQTRADAKRYWLY